MAAGTLELVASRSDPRGEADLWLLRARSVADLAARVTTADWHDHVASLGGFGLLLAWTGPAPDFAEVSALARILIEQGMFYFGAWGAGSARVEYAVDVTDLTIQLDGSPAGDAPIVMTTAFGAVPVAEALFELWELAPRDEGKAPGPARVVVLLGPDPQAALAMAIRSRGAS